MNDFITWEVLGTFAGMTAVVCALTQLVKQYLSCDPKWIALVLSLVITVTYNVFAVGIHGGGDVVLALLNSLAVTGASSGLFETVVKPVARKIGTQK